MSLCDRGGWFLQPLSLAMLDSSPSIERKLLSSQVSETNVAIQIEVKKGIYILLDCEAIALRTLLHFVRNDGLNAKVLQSHYCSQAPLVRKIWLSLDFIKQDGIQGVFILLFSTQWLKKHIMKSLMKRKQLRFLLKMRRNLIFDRYQLHWSCLELLDLHSGDMQTTISFLSDV